MHVLWHADSSITGSPVIGGGQVWALDSGGGVCTRWACSTAYRTARCRSASVSRFATPALSGRRILVGTLSGLTVVKY